MRFYPFGCAPLQEILVLNFKVCHIFHGAFRKLLAQKQWTGCCRSGQSYTHWMRAFEEGEGDTLHSGLLLGIFLVPALYRTWFCGISEVCTQILPGHSYPLVLQEFNAPNNLIGHTIMKQLWQLQPVHPSWSSCCWTFCEIIMSMCDSQPEHRTDL